MFEWEAIIGGAADGDLLFVVYTERAGRLRPFHVRKARAAKASKS